MALQFKIQIKNIFDPPIWRRLLVPEQFTFLQMHKVIQASFGWDDYHLFQFSPKGYASYPLIGIPEPEFAADTLEAKKIKLSEIVKTPKQKFTYIYDFGDDWIHQISLEKISDEKLLRAQCLAGKGACPPEDCGGPRGYAELKITLANPKDPDHAETKVWLGLTKKQKWDAEAFDLENTKALVAKV
jgi:hypothetical protein